MALSLEHAYDELRAALAAPEDDVFYDLVAISGGLLTSGHSDRDLESWSTTAANGILERGIPIDKLSCYDTLDPRVSALIFRAAATELVGLWPTKPLPNLLTINTDEGLRALASALPSTLRELQLGSPENVTPQALEALKDSLPSGATIW